MFYFPFVNLLYWIYKIVEPSEHVLSCFSIHPITVVCGFCFVDSYEGTAILVSRQRYLEDDDRAEHVCRALQPHLMGLAVANWKNPKTKEVNREAISHIRGE